MEKKIIYLDSDWNIVKDARDADLVKVIGPDGEITIGVRADETVKRQHMGPGDHPSGSPQSVHAGGKDWQGRDLKPDRVLAGGNLTPEEVAIIDLAHSDPSARFRAKDVDPETLRFLRDQGVVMPVQRLLKSADQYYQLTSRGHELKTQLYLVRKRLEYARQNAFEGHRGRPGQRGGSLPRSAGTGPTPKAVLDIYRKKIQHEPAITKKMTELQEKNEGRLVGLNSRIKTEESFGRKAQVEAEELGLSPEEYADQITDAVRYTMAFESPEKFSNSVKAVETDLLKSGYKRYDHKRRNYFDPSYSDGTYQGYNTVWISPAGDTFELQFHTEQSLKIKYINHELYEVARVSKDQGERARLFQQMVDNWKSPEYQAPKNFEILSAGD